MGNNACRCECNKEDETAEPVVSASALSQFEEEVAPRAPAVVEAPPPVAPQAPPALKEKPEKPEKPSTRFSDEEPERVPPPLKVEPEVSPAPKQEAPKVNDESIRHVSFDLEAEKPLGVVFAELSMPEPKGSLVVTSVAEDSPLAKPLSGDRGTRPGDLVLDVNGHGGDKGVLLKVLQQARKKGGKLDLVLRVRPETFEVSLKKESEDQKMGVVVAVHDEVPDRLEVRHICDQGALPTWNEEHPTLQVVSGDWVTSVNGTRAAANEMIGAMQFAWIKGGDFRLEVKTNVDPSGS